MYEHITISEKKLAKLAKKISKAFSIYEEEAFEIIYDEWELVEKLFQEHKKIKAVYTHMIDDLKHSCRTA